MKTARFSRFQAVLHVALPVGLLATVFAATILPGFPLHPELVALALSGLIIHAFGALALLGRRRPLPLRGRHRALRAVPDVAPLGAGMLPVRPRSRGREGEALAA